MVSKYFLSLLFLLLLSSFSAEARTCHCTHYYRDPIFDKIHTVDGQVECPTAEYESDIYCSGYTSRREATTSCMNTVERDERSTTSHLSGGWEPLYNNCN